MNVQNNHHLCVIQHFLKERTRILRKIINESKEQYLKMRKTVITEYLKTLQINKPAFGQFRKRLQKNEWAKFNLTAFVDNT